MIIDMLIVIKHNLSKLYMCRARLKETEALCKPIAHLGSETPVELCWKIIGNMVKAKCGKYTLVMKGF